MSDSDAWSPLDIDSPDSGLLPLPSEGVHVVGILAAPGARAGDWAPRAALEISRAWSADGARVFLCDTAFEEPALHRVAGLDAPEGVSDALMFGTSFKRLAQPLSDGLFLASAGTPVPDAEALRLHPRWRDFVTGFREAGAVLVLYLPADAAGGEELLRQCGSVVVLATESEADRVAAFVDTARVSAFVGPHPAEGSVAEEPVGGEAAVADDDREPMVLDAEAFGVEGEPLTLAGEDEAPPPQAEADPGGEIPPMDLSELGDDFAELTPTEEFADAAEEVASGESSDPLASRDPLGEEPTEVGGEAAPTLEAILQDQEAGPSEAGSGDGDEAPAPAESVAPTRSAPQRRGSGRLLLLILLIVILALVLAGLMGLVTIPGIAPLQTPADRAARAAGTPGGDRVAWAAELQPSGIGGEVGPGPMGATAPGGVATPSAPRPAGSSAQVRAPRPVDAPVPAWVFAVASFRDLDAARDRAARLAMEVADVQFIVAPVQVEGTPYYRLLAGPAVDSLDLAGIRRRMAEALPYEDAAEWIIREARLAFFLGEMPRLEMAERNVSVMERRGIPAHILQVPGPSGTPAYRVYTGAYATEEEASFLARVLSSQDIDNAPLVERRGIPPE